MKRLILIVVLAVFVLGLIVPVASAAPPASNGYWYRVKYGDTLYSISRHSGVSVKTLIHVNGIKHPNLIYAGQSLWIPKKGHQTPGHGRYHTVKYGQTLTGIGRMYRVSPWAIARLNGIYDMNHIYAGQRLRIP